MALINYLNRNTGHYETIDTSFGEDNNPSSTASNISYDNSISKLDAENVQDAIDEIFVNLDKFPSVLNLSGNNSIYTIKIELVKPSSRASILIFANLNSFPCIGNIVIEANYVSAVGYLSVYQDNELRSIPLECSITEDGTLSISHARLSYSKITLMSYDVDFEGSSVTGGTINISDKSIDFESDDTLSPESYEDMPLIESNSTLKTLMSRFSTVVRNIRYLWNIFGSTDISQIGDGTLTGAISELNRNLDNKDITNAFRITYSQCSTERIQATIDTFGRVTLQFTLKLTAFDKSNTLTLIRVEEYPPKILTNGIIVTTDKDTVNINEVKTFNTNCIVYINTDGTVYAKIPENSDSFPYMHVNLVYNTK